mgnify:CR=1 FL=1
MKLRRISVVVAAAAIAGCAPMIPDYKRPAPPVAPTLPGVAAAPGTADTFTLLKWQDEFADPRLRELIGLALAENRDLRIAALSVERARASYQIQEANVYPWLSANGQELAQQLPADLSPTGRARTMHQYSATFGLNTWEIDFFGRLRSLNEQALQEYLGTEEGRRAAQVTVVGEVARTWLALALARELTQVSRETYEVRKKAYELARKSFDAGVYSALDVKEQETLMETARGDAARYEAAAGQALNALALAVGAPVPAHLQPDTITATVTAVTDVPAGVRSDVLLQRPDIARAERQLLAANANIGAARAAFFPRITLTGYAGTATASLDGLFAGGSGVWNLLPQISVPIFNAGSLQASLDAATIQRDINVAQYERSIQNAFREVADALAERATLAEQLDARRKQVAAAEQGYRLSEARYRGGVDTYVNSLLAQRNLYLAQQELVLVRHADATNRVAIYRTMGGGWQ